jgi:hypothetical protein
MYKIIGSDGHQYGPASAEQLRAWLAEGRINPNTQVQADGATDWKPFGSLPEFADVATDSNAASSTTPPPITPPAVNPEALAAEILARGYEVQCGDYIRKAWELVKKDFWLLVGVSFIGGLISAGGGIPYIGPLIALVIGGAMRGGMCAFYLKKIRGQEATFGDAFIGFSVAFVPLMLATIVSGLLECVGLLLCLIPGFYLMVAWCFTLPLVIDKRLDFWPAMELSRKVVTKHWWAIFGFLILCFLLALGGFLCCCIGIFVASPVIEVAVMYAYEDIFCKPKS